MRNELIDGFTVTTDWHGNHMLKEDDAIIEAMKLIDGNGNEGAEIEFYDCKKHGKSLHIVLYNEGGHCSVSSCIECLNELKDNKDIINFAKANSKLYEKYKGR